MSFQSLSHTLRRSHLPPICTSHIQQQVRHATLIKRPYRPYTFTQLVTLSDGSTFLTRTTSPAPVYKSTKDSRNHPLWQPSSAALRNVEADEAGRLRAFRRRFGRGWDSEEVSDDPTKIGNHQQNLMDLINDQDDSSETPLNTSDNPKKSQDTTKKS